MHKYAPYLLSLAASLLLACPGHSATKAAATVKKQPPPPDYFPLVKDYWWKYQSEASTGKSGYELKVVDVEVKPDKTVIYDLHTKPQVAEGAMGSAGFDEWHVKPRGWVLVIKAKNGTTGDIASYDPPRKLIENPLKVDDTWDWSGKRWGGVEASENNKVEAVEEVEVPAGKFRAMKVTTQITQGGMPMTKTYWYAPWIGLVQYQTESGGVTSLTKLIDYSFKKPAKTP